MGKKANPAIVGAFVLGAARPRRASACWCSAPASSSASTVEVVMYFPGSVDGLSTGAPVKFKGVDIGIGDQHPADPAQQREEGPEGAHPGLRPDRPEQDHHRPARPPLPDPQAREELINRGMRAQLQSQSMLTGLLFIQLDFFPDTPANYVA